MSLSCAYCLRETLNTSSSLYPVGGIACKFIDVIMYSPWEHRTIFVNDLPIKCWQLPQPYSTSLMSLCILLLNVGSYHRVAKVGYQSRITLKFSFKSRTTEKQFNPYHADYEIREQSSETDIFSLQTSPHDNKSFHLLC